MSVVTNIKVFKNLHCVLIINNNTRICIEDYNSNYSENTVYIITSYLD